MIKAAIIGVSGFGNVHYKDLISYQERGKLQIAAAAIINQEEEAEKCSVLKNYGCKIFTDYKEMLAEFKGELDICFIPTGISMHAPMSIAAVEAGANVYVEKPVVAVLPELEKMKAAQERTGKFIAVGYQTIYQPSIAKIKNTVLDGKIGEFKTAKFLGITVRDKKYYDRNNWAGCIKRGDSWILDSPYNNAMAHQLNLLCFFAGRDFTHSAEIKTVQANLFRTNPAIENADNAAIEIITSDDKKLLYYATHNAPVNETVELIIEGTKGTINWTFAETVYNLDGNKEVCANNDNRDYVMDALIAKIKGEKSFICDISIAGAQTLAMNAAHASSPVVEVPADYVSTQPFGDSTSECLKDIAGIMRNVYNEERLFSTADYPWMKTGKLINIKNDDIQALIEQNV
jgi:predicted dehydrogenase